MVYAHAHAPVEPLPNPVFFALFFLEVLPCPAFHAGFGLPAAGAVYGLVGDAPLAQMPGF